MAGVFDRLLKSKTTIVLFLNNRLTFYVNLDIMFTQQWKELCCRHEF